MFHLKIDFLGLERLKTHPKIITIQIYIHEIDISVITITMAIIGISKEIGIYMEEVNIMKVIKKTEVEADRL